MPGASGPLAALIQPLCVLFEAIQSRDKPLPSERVGPAHRDRQPSRRAVKDRQALVHRLVVLFFGIRAWQNLIHDSAQAIV
jgi:hypothetical protein